ncbi:hypothetical protein KAQ80_01695, partial [Candidatus Bipolaricaulota bacterium]|nr:hypothetical protein [Candidatus Bipolaricaulota bacterium]
MPDSWIASHTQASKVPHCPQKQANLAHFGFCLATLSGYRSLALGIDVHSSFAKDAKSLPICSRVWVEKMA